MLAANLKKTTELHLNEFIGQIEESKFKLIERSGCANFELVTSSLQRLARQKGASTRSGRASFELFREQLVEACEDVRKTFNFLKVADSESDRKWKLMEQVCRCVPGRNFELPNINEANSLDFDNKLKLLDSKIINNIVVSMGLSPESAAFDSNEWLVSREQLTKVLFSVANDFAEKLNKKSLNEQNEDVFDALESTCKQIELFDTIIWLADNGFVPETSESTGHKMVLATARLCHAANVQQVNFKELKLKWQKEEDKLINRLMRTMRNLS